MQHCKAVFLALLIVWALPHTARSDLAVVPGGCAWEDNDSGAISPREFFLDANDSPEACAAACAASASPPLETTFWGVGTQCDAWDFYPVTSGTIVDARPAATGMCFLHHWPPKLLGAALSRGPRPSIHSVCSGGKMDLAMSTPPAPLPPVPVSPTPKALPPVPVTPTPAALPLVPVGPTLTALPLMPVNPTPPKPGPPQPNPCHSATASTPAISPGAPKLHEPKDLPPSAGAAKVHEPKVAALPPDEPGPPQQHRSTPAPHHAPLHHTPVRRAPSNNGTAAAIGAIGGVILQGILSHSGGHGGNPCHHR
jgi:hypothetical protein